MHQEIALLVHLACQQLRTMLRVQSPLPALAVAASHQQQLQQWHASVLTALQPACMRQLNLTLPQKLLHLLGTVLLQQA